MGTPWDKRSTAVGRDDGAAKRWVARASLALGVVAIVVGLVAPPASANYPRIAAEVGCDRLLSWAATASSEGTDEDRTNTDVLVEYRPAGGEDAEWLPAGDDASGVFDAGNDFRFSGQLQLPDGVDAVEVRVSVLGPWGADGDGASPGEPRFARAELPESCADAPVAARVDVDCSAGTATIDLRSTAEPGASPIDVVVSADGVELRTLQPTPGADGVEQLVVPLLDGRGTELTAEAADVVVLDREVGGDCPVEGPAAAVLERCGPGDAVVLARAGVDTGAELRVRALGAIVAEVDLAADEATQQTLSLPPGPTEVEVLLDDTTAAIGPVGGCDGPVAGLVSCGTAGRAACATPDDAAGDAPPPPPPPLVIDLEGDELATTGPWERAIAILLGGALLAGGGLVMLEQDRRRPRASGLAQALAPYRQTWWDRR